MNKIGCMNYAHFLKSSHIYIHKYIPQTVLQVEWPKPDENNFVHKDWLVIHCHYSMVWIICD